MPRQSRSHPLFAFIPLILVLAVLSLPASAFAESPDESPGKTVIFTLPIGNFSAGDLSGWEEKSFVDNTRYQIIDSEQGKVLRASTQNSASGLFKTRRIDLTRTPWLHWSWRVDKTFSGNDERSKAGDDYPARIYVVVDGGVFFWKTRAVNYVWSSNQPKGSSWPNAYTGNAKMIAVRSGTTDSGRWQKERRNVRADLKRLFGEDITHIDAVAVMTDSDNTGQGAAASYGDIYFTSE